MILTATQTGEMLGVDQRSIRRWTRDKGCPKMGRDQWDANAVLSWWLQNIYAGDEETEELAAAKLEYWQAKARSEKVKADVAEGATMSVPDFRASWAWRVAEMSSGLGALPLRLATLLAGKKEIDIRGILQTEIWSIRDKFCREGTFTPTSEKKYTPPKAKPAKRGPKPK